MTETVEVPLWLFVMILVFAAVTFASHFLFPSVRWFVRRRLERAVERLNRRLERPIEPFKLARRYDMIQRLIYDPQVTRAVADHAAELGVPENVAFEMARRYAREIVPTFSAFTYFSFAIRAARFLSNAVYRVRLAYSDEAALSAIDRSSTVVYVMNHRSNMDYVLVTYLAARRSALSYAVGEWARVWPLSRLIRGMGAYFIRRRSGNELYRQVLAAYVRLATGGGVTQAIFPEGGLSLTGAPARPRLGLLKYIVDGSRATGRNVVFVPVALNYDRVLEDKILTSAAKRGERRFRARIWLIVARIMRQLWYWLTGRYNRSGYAAVTFGRPISLAGQPMAEGDAVVRDLARDLMTEIAQSVPVLPVPLVAYVLCRDGALTPDSLRARVQALLAVLPAASRQHLPDDALDGDLDDALRRMVRRKLLRHDGAGRIAPRPDYEDLLRYYGNSIAHLVPQAGDGEADYSAPAQDVSASARL